MNHIIKPFLEWFGYSRKERRSSFILLIILFVIIAFRYFVPLRETEIEDLSRTLFSPDMGPKSHSDTSVSFSFNPNNASLESMTMAGLSEKQATTIINYRKKGGAFRDTADIRKIYGIDDKTAALVIPRMVIDKDTGRAVSYHPVRQARRVTGERVDLNKCDSAALMRLPGLGPVLSSRIIKFRNLLGGFVSADQLKEVYGLPEATYNNLLNRVFADSSVITGIKINDVGYKELSKHPYLNRYEIESIIKYKELKGRFISITEMVDNKIISAERAKKLSPYLKF